VNAVEALSKSNVPFVPNTLVMGGGTAVEERSKAIGC